MTDGNVEAEALNDSSSTQPEEAINTSDQSLEANSDDHGENDSASESDDAKSRRQERAEFFKRKEELEKEYKDKLDQLENRKVDYQEGDQKGHQVKSSDEVQTLKRDLAEVTLKQEGITHEDDINQVLEIADSMKVSPKEIVGLTWVQSMLADNQKVRRNTAATPSSSNRSGHKSAKETVAYYMNRTDLPPKENKELRRAVIKARADNQRKSIMFNN